MLIVLLWVKGPDVVSIAGPNLHGD